MGSTDMLSALNVRRLNFERSPKRSGASRGECASILGELRNWPPSPIDLIDALSALN
jgi:hypothetical protein